MDNFLVLPLLLCCYSLGWSQPQELHLPPTDSTPVTKLAFLDLPYLKSGTPLTLEVQKGYALLEGDIIVGTEVELFAPQAIATSRPQARWPKGVIPYVIASGHPRVNEIQRAIQQINSKTNIQMVPQTNQQDYLQFIIGRGCSSFVGRVGGRQQINIGIYCDYGAILHEICHAVGLWHEQSRCDRDQHVTIEWANIHDYQRHNFDKHCRDGVDMGPYDYNSIMHYSAYAFSKNGQPTIVPKSNPGVRVGQRSDLSSGDVAAINKLYPKTQTTGHTGGGNQPNPNPIAHNKMITAIRDFGLEADWRKDRHERCSGDVNGDGRTDIIGFGEDAVLVAFGQKDGTFASPQIGTRYFTYTNGDWRVQDHVRTVGDVNGDGKADIIGFSDRGVEVGLAQPDGTFGNPVLVLADFGAQAGGWDKTRHVRRVGDVNGDGRTDIVGFGADAVLVALGQADGTFADPYLGIRNFTYGQGGWRTEKHERLVADVNGDGRADIVGFGEYRVKVALARADGTFADPIDAVDDFTYGTGGWRKEKHVRRVGDVNGDGRADIVGFGYQAVFVAYGQPDGSFSNPKAVYNDFAYTAGGWRVEKHERLVGDVNGDRCDDIIGFGQAQTYTLSLK